MSKCVCAALVTLSCLLSLAAAQSSTPTTALSYIPNTRIRPFPYLQSSNYALLQGATVSIEFGYQPGEDSLILDYTGEYDITAKYSNGVLWMSGAAPTSVYMTAISSVIFYTTADDGAARRITWSFGEKTVYSALTGHYYEYNEHVTSWNTSMATCGARKKFGLQGYLATVTSADEMAAVGGKLTFTAYIGASDANKEGIWTWATGREKGTQFWEKGNQFKGGKPVGGQYSDWARFQPNNGGASTNPKENYLAVQPSASAGVAYFADVVANNGAMGYICEFGGMDNDATVAMTTSEYANSVVLTFGCDLFTSPTDCANHAAYGCAAIGDACVTIPLCGSLKDEATCNSNWQCQWAVDSDIGQCGTTRCGRYSDADTCASDDQCTAKTVGSQKQCLPAKCEDRVTASTCSALSNCQWYSNTCMAEQTYGCSDMDMVFMLDGTAPMGTRWNRFSTGFQGLTDQLAELDWTINNPAAQNLAFVQYGPETMADSSAQTGGEMYNKLLWQTKNVQAALERQQNAFGIAPGTRQISSAINTAVNILKKGPASRKKVLVIFAAGGIVDAQAVAASGLLTSDITVIGYALQPNSQISLDGTDALASLNAMTPNAWRLSILDVQTAVTNLCNPFNAAGMKTNPTTTAWPAAQTCFSYTASGATAASMENCAKDKNCGFDQITHTCRPTLCAQNSVSDCAQVSGCAVDGTMCVQKCPHQTTSAACGTQANCTWDSAGSFCKDKPCLGNPTEDSCVGDSAKCRWIGATLKFSTTGAEPTRIPGRCEPMVCATLDSSSCTKAMGCIYLSGVCMKDYCTGETTKNNCEDPSKTMNQCVWTAEQCKQSKCGAQSTEKGCGATGECEWNVDTAPGLCKPADCTGYNLDPTTQEQMCLANPRCNFTNIAGTKLCRPRLCSDIPTSDLCAPRTDCVWRNGNCKDVRFVQCPGIDLIVAVESSPAMAQDFGRHPSGFYGVMEQLRAWGEEMPFSKADPTATGFRIQLQLFGGSTVSSYPTGNALYDGSSDSKFPWTGGNSWLAQARSYFADNGAKTDASNVQLVGVLNQAEATLKAYKSDTTRKKVVVILGHSPIADNVVSDLNAKMIAVEAPLPKGQNAQVFSYIVRRFNEFTVNDTAAAERMAPFSTDPRATHFAFTTIDTMRQQIFDTFCVPTTTVGKALGVSRDNTLPCNWLDGQTECNVQPSCSFNSTATVTCPLPEQCPNLGCQALPESLAKSYHCNNCKSVNGGFECSTGKTYTVPTGLCVTDACMSQSNVNCGGTAGCTWNTDKMRCERQTCGYTTTAACNADLACFWQDAGLSMPGGGTTPAGPSGNGMCVKSSCGLIRSLKGCNSQISIVSGEKFDKCFYRTDLSPAICQQSRCTSYSSVANGCTATNGCVFQNAGARPCAIKKCRYPTRARCEMDATCYWNPEDGVCKFSDGTCKMSTNYSAWSACTSSCAYGIQYRTRTIYSEANIVLGETSCAAQAVKDGRPLVETQRCYAKSSTQCDTYCSSTYASDPVGCGNDISCMWDVTCKIRGSQPCHVLGQTDCQTKANTTCAWDTKLQFCFPAVPVCKSSPSPDQCNGKVGCRWVTGASNNADAANWGITSQLVNPGQNASLVFPTLRMESDDMIDGATVMIEGNYSVGGDMLSFNYMDLQSKFVPSAGVMYIWGAATVSQYAAALRTVAFTTTSVSIATRLVTWSLGKNTLYSAITGHFYMPMTPTSAVSYGTAASKCTSANLVWGRYGYLAAVNSAHENGILSAKFDMAGWISGEDRTQGQWRLTSGPQADSPFWTGGSFSMGGRVAPDMYANWADSQPAYTGKGFSYAYLQADGYWQAWNSSNKAMGYFCEFGGLSNDIGFAAYEVSGATTIAAGGCVPKPCVYHNDVANCERDTMCAWDQRTGSCRVGCRSFATAGDCSTAAHCVWDTTTVPASCAVDKCRGLKQTDCQGATYGTTCLWSSSNACVYRTGCAVYTEADCSTKSKGLCYWPKPTSSEASQNIVCAATPCDRLSDENMCTQNSQCVYNAETRKCSDSTCTTGDEALCKADKRCTWQDGLGGTAATFIPGGASVLPFESGIPVTSDISSKCSGVTVSIVQGFQKGQDVLMVRSGDDAGGLFEPPTYNRQTGVLVANVAGAAGDSVSRFDCYQYLKESVRFFTTSNTVAARRLVYTFASNGVINDKNDKIFQYVPTAATSFSTASDVCVQWANTYNFDNTTARVAVVDSQIDNMRLRALGAQGWLSATVAAGTQNWAWPGTTTNFWEGAGATGEPVNSGFAQWASDQPTTAGANSRAFLLSSGFWKVVSSTDSTIPAGIICQYDTPKVVVAGSRNVAPSGCFKAVCLGLSFDACRQNPTCNWKDGANNDQATGTCTLDTWCTSQRTPTTCGARELCYWDFDLGACRTSPGTACSAKATQATCKGSTGCDWVAASIILPRSTAQDGVCMQQGCGSKPAKSTCQADPKCKWKPATQTKDNTYRAQCTARLCGYLIENDCWADKQCYWEKDYSRCRASDCIKNAATSAACTGAQSCVVSGSICAYSRCGTSLTGEAGRTACETDSICLWGPSGCSKTDCSQHDTSVENCEADPKCYYTYKPNKCIAAQCTSNADLSDCEKGETDLAKKPCVWNTKTDSCREKTEKERRANPAGPAPCQREEYGALWWLWVLAALILLLIIGIFYRLYLAYKHGLSFFEPARNTKTFSPHAGVGMDVFEEANGEETNAVATYKPTADEL